MSNRPKNGVCKFGNSAEGVLLRLLAELKVGYKVACCAAMKVAPESLLPGRRTEKSIVEACGATCFVRDAEYPSRYPATSIAVAGNAQLCNTFADQQLLQ